MQPLESLPPPREIDLGNGVVQLENAYSIFSHGRLIGVEYEHAYFTNSDMAAATMNEAFFCPHCGEIWARKRVRAFPLWIPQGWIVREVACNGVALSLDDEALREYPELLFQAMDAFLFELGSQCPGVARRAKPATAKTGPIHDARAPVAPVIGRLA